MRLVLANSVRRSFLPITLIGIVVIYFVFRGSKQSPSDGYNTTAEVILDWTGMTIYNGLVSAGTDSHASSKSERVLNDIKPSQSLTVNSPIDPDDSPSGQQTTSSDIRHRRSMSAVDGWFSYIERNYFANPNRSVVYRCKRTGCGGWADRVKGILSTLLIALVTRRSVGIDITHPCPLSDILAPNSILWNTTVADVANRGNGSRELQITLSGDTAEHRNFKNVLESKNLSSLDIYDTIVIRGNDMILDQMKKWYDATDLGGINSDHLTLDTFYPSAYDRLFKVQPAESMERDALLSLVKLNGAKLICVQMRIGKSETLPEDVEMLKSKHRDKMVEDMLAAAKNLSIEHRQSYVFVTTDSEQARSRARQILGDRMLEIAGRITHIDRSTVQQACQNLRKVIVDFDMLSYCNTSLISNSGFGYFGNLRRRDPYSNLYLYCRRLHQVKSKREWDTTRWRNLPC